MSAGRTDSTAGTEKSGHTSQSNWTTPFHGVQHFGYDTRHSTNGRWATVTDRKLFAELDAWYAGCQFSPYEATFSTAEDARRAGERWVAHGVFPNQKPSVRDLCDPAWSPTS